MTCSQKVTEPTMVSVTCMSAPKRPVATIACMARARITKKSNNRHPASWGAAGVKEDRVPDRESAANFGHAATHFSGLIGKHAVRQQFAQQCIRLAVTIFFLCAYQRHLAWAV